MLPLLLLALVPADHPDGRLDARTTRAYDLPTLTEAAAEWLQGRPALYLVELDSLPEDYDDWTLYDCVGADAVSGSVWMHQGEPVADKMMVLAMLRLIRHPARGEFPEFTEYRLVGARRAR